MLGKFAWLVGPGGWWALSLLSGQVATQVLGKYFLRGCKYKIFSNCQLQGPVRALLCERRYKCGKCKRQLNVEGKVGQSF